MPEGNSNGKLAAGDDPSGNMQENDEMEHVMAPDHAGGGHGGDFPPMSQNPGIPQNSTARRCLFGRPVPGEFKEDCARWQQEQEEELKAKYNFDFERDVPCTSPNWQAEPKFQWEQVSALDVPLPYLSYQVRMKIEFARANNLLPKSQVRPVVEKPTTPPMSPLLKLVPNAIKNPPYDMANATVSGENGEPGTTNGNVPDRQTLITDFFEYDDTGKRID